MTEETPRTVLVVEDDAAMREFLVESLCEDGYSLLSAPNGRQGIQQIRAGGIDLVVTDIRMPDMDGLDMVREINTLSAPPDVITITA